jgi:CelD/BcsL family acetyltransferase involved in cellulose biosynthesis
VSVVAERIATLEDLDRMRADWHALWRRSPGATVFQSPDWLIPWWRHFAPGELISIALWDGEDLVGLLPLYREEGGRRVLPLGISLSDRLDVLVAEGNGHSVHRVLEAEMIRVPGCSEICFPDIAPNAPLLSLAFEGFSANKSTGQSSPELVLGPAGNPLANVPAHQRQNLRTAENRARRRGCVTNDVAAEHLREFVSALMQLHSTRQRHLGRDGLGRDARVLPFFIEAFTALVREGVVRAYSIVSDERLIGGYLGFLHCGRASYYFAGFDPQFAFESPGTILIGHAIRSAAAEGAYIFDFLRGAESYKYAWGARDRQLLSLSFARQFSDVELAS